MCVTILHVCTVNPVYILTLLFGLDQTLKLKVLSHEMIFCPNDSAYVSQMGKSSHCPSFHLMLLQFLISFSLHTIWYSSDC